MIVNHDGSDAVDSNGMHIMDRGECIGLLKQASIGRLGLSLDALPVVVPVNYVIDGERVVIRTNKGTKTAAALQKSVVAFEIDSFDAVSHSGWSVLAQGTSYLEKDETELKRLRSLPLRPWVDPEAEIFFVIDIDLLSGRRTQSKPFPY